MTSDLITPSKSLGYSKLYLDYVAGRDPAAGFFLGRNIERVTTQLESIKYHRVAMAAILERQNRSYDCPDKTLKQILRLREENTLCIFTGQQAGLYSGPMLVIFKALGIIKAAEFYSQKLNRPVIPIFWIAGDDHDFEEANHTFALSRNGSVEKISYETFPEFEIPTSEIRFDDQAGLEQAKASLVNCLGKTDFTDELYDLIDQSYRTGETMVSAFGRFMTRLLGDRGLVLFSPGDPEAKAIAAPLFHDIVDRQESLHEALTSTNRAIIDSGYHLQVEKKEDSAHLFYNFEGRRPILRDGNSFTVHEQTISRDQLHQLIDQHPERFSPDVMTRPLLQSYLFPVLSQKGGPAEIAYLAQINPLFELFGLAAPVHKARPTVTLVEGKFQKIMLENQVTFEDLTGDIEQVINKILERSFPKNLQENFEALRAKIEKEFASFATDSLSFDRSLQSFSEQTRGKIDYSIKAFEGKVFSSHKKKSQEMRDRIYRLEASLFPRRGLQERTVNITVFLAKYGPGLVDSIYEHFDCEESAHQIINLSEFS